MLVPQINLQEFEERDVDFVGPINPPRKRTCACYIIIATNYLTRWVEATLVKDCTTVTTSKFLFDNVVTIFGFPNILISDQGTHFIY